MEQRRKAFLENNCENVEIVIFVLMLVMSAVAYSVVVRFGFDDMPTDDVISSAMNLLGILITTILIVSKLMERGKRTNEDMLLTLIVFVMHFKMFLQLTATSLGRYNEFSDYLEISDLFLYLSSPILLVVFWCYMVELLRMRKKLWRKLTTVVQLLIVLDFVYIALNPLFHHLYYTDKRGNAIYTAWLPTVYVVPTIVLIMLVWLIISSKTKRYMKWLTVSFPLFPIVCMGIELYNSTTNIVMVGELISTLLIYTSIHVQRADELAKIEMKLMEQRTRIIISQIQPHFIYNTLNTIGYLCTKEPEMARKATDCFSQYLRNNLQAIDEEKLIPFKEEIGHTQTYIWLEQLRFGNRVTVTYNIEVEEFRIPALTLQPIVENAIKHGICQREEGGNIIIETRETASDYVITVSDDGVGYDEDAIEAGDKKHVGLKNVRERLKLMCEGSIHCSSTVGVGTICKIYLPKERNE